MRPTYLIYTDHADVAKANLYAEMGQVYAVPRAGEQVTVDGTAYTVVGVIWVVYTAGPEQTAFVLLRSL